MSALATIAALTLARTVGFYLALRFLDDMRSEL